MVRPRLSQAGRLPNAERFRGSRPEGQAMPRARARLAPLSHRSVPPLRLEQISLAGFDRGVSPTGFAFAVIRLLTLADLIR
jgi:hypothetical protein